MKDSKKITNRIHQNRWYEGQKNPEGIHYEIVDKRTGDTHAGFTTNSLRKRFNQHWAARYTSNSELNQMLRSGYRDDFMIREVLP